MDNAEWFLNEARSLRDSLTAAHKAGEEVRRQLAEAVKLLERWEGRWKPFTRTYVANPLDADTRAFLSKVRP